MAQSVPVRLPSLTEETNDATLNGAFVMVDREDYSEAKRTPVNKLAQRVPVPATVVSTGLVGQWAEDNDYLYICVATNTWRRVALASW